MCKLRGLESGSSYVCGLLEVQIGALCNVTHGIL